MLKPISLFGEVLFDQFPDGQHILGGAPFNVAWHLQAFGQQPQFISRVGDDSLGKTILAAMQNWGLNDEFLQFDSEHPTGTVQISLIAGEPTYHIRNLQAYDFITEPKKSLASSGILYHGTLALRHLNSANTLRQLLANHTGEVFIDVNLRAPWWQTKEVSNWLANADWVKLNTEELAALISTKSTLAATMQAFLSTYQLKALIVTQGELGAVALTAQGELLAVSPKQSVDVVDTVGAGDAFSSVLLLGIRLGWPLAVTLPRAQEFASAIVGQHGATVQDIAFYQSFIDQYFGQILASQNPEVTEPGIGWR